MVTQIVNPEHIADNDQVLDFVYQHFEIYHLDREDILFFLAKKYQRTDLIDPDTAFRNAMIDALNMTNDKMKALSERMSEIYSENHFYADLEQAIDDLGITFPIESEKK